MTTDLHTAIMAYLKIPDFFTSAVAEVSDNMRARYAAAARTKRAARSLSARTRRRLRRALTREALQWRAPSYTPARHEYVSAALVALS